MSKLLKALLKWTRSSPVPGLNPVKFSVRRGKTRNSYYSRVERSGQIIFDGAESYKNRRDSVAAIVNTIKAIESGNYVIDEE